jgi:hypothetical protein
MPNCVAGMRTIAVVLGAMALTSEYKWPIHSISAPEILVVASPPEPAQGEQEVMRANILLVDDEPSVLRYTKTLLEIDNYRVETAGSGEEANNRARIRLE